MPQATHARRWPPRTRRVHSGTAPVELRACGARFKTKHMCISGFTHVWTCEEAFGAVSGCGMCEACEMASEVRLVGTAHDTARAAPHLGHHANCALQQRAPTPADIVLREFEAQAWAET
eukprot:17002-Chlamydomonas_euryale.AAC.3